MNHHANSLLLPDFRALFESAPAKFMVLAPDSPRFTIIAASDAYLRATKKRREEIVGRPVFDVFPENPGDPCGAEANSRSSFERVLQRRIPDAQALQRHDISRLPEEGGGFESRFWSPLNTPVLDENGQVRYIIHRVEDVTELIVAKNGQARQHDLPVQAESLLDAERIRCEADQARDRQNRLQYFYESGIIGVVFWNMDGCITDANDKFLEMVGYSRTDLLAGRIDWRRLTPPEYRRLDEESVRELKTAGINRNPIEREYIRKDGYRLPALAKGVMLDDDRRNVMAFVLDATQWKRTEEALRESEQRFRAVAENMSEGLVLFDAGGNVLYQNPVALRIHGYLEQANEEFQYKRMPSAWKAWDEQGNPLDFANWPISRVVQSERFQNQVVRAMNVESGKEWYGSYNGSPITDADGKLVMGFITIHDMTDSKMAEEKLRGSEKRYRSLFESIDEGFCVIEVLFDDDSKPNNWRYLEVNPAFERHNGLRDSLGKTIVELVPDIESRWFEIYGKVAITGESVRFIEFSEAFGRWWDLYAFRVGDPEEHKVAVIFNNITERKRMEEELREANATLEHKIQERTSQLTQQTARLRALAGELAVSEQRERSRLAKVLHDHLQQLLVATKFRLTILGRGGDDVIKQAINEVQELIDESIAASRSLTAELSPPILHEAGLNAGLQWLARRMADKHGLFVELEMEEHELLAEPLKILLFESIRELLFNVVKHARTSSANLSVRCVDDYLQVTVSDQGAGFDPTMSVADTAGRGFGLFALRERLEFMGGTLAIQSAPGLGSRFVISVPIVSAEKTEPQSKGTVLSPDAHFVPYSVPKPGQRIRVMLVDDHAVVRQGIANLLGDEPDIDVIAQAANGQEAVESVPLLLPDVILMDMSMQKLNGVEATRIIHNDWPEIRIIGLSMFEEADRAQAMRDAGAVDYLTKSGPAETLINAIKSSVRSSKKDCSD
jgi:PAS domain S-box-containing protein